MSSEPQDHHLGSARLQPQGKDDRNLAMISHLSGLLWWTTTLHLLIPLGIWLLQRGKSPFVEDQAKEALNAQISFSVYAFVSGILILVLIGWLLLPIVAITFLVLCIRGGLAASKGRPYRYPFIFRLVT